jgi:hypothetical protein
MMVTEWYPYTNLSEPTSGLHASLVQSNKASTTTLGRSEHAVLCFWETEEDTIHVYGCCYKLYKIESGVGHGVSERMASWKDGFIVGKWDHLKPKPYILCTYIYIRIYIYHLSCIIYHISYIIYYLLSIIYYILYSDGHPLRTYFFHFFLHLERGTKSTLRT